LQENDGQIDAGNGVAAGFKWRLMKGFGPQPLLPLTFIQKILPGQFANYLPKPVNYPRDSDSYFFCQGKHRTAL